MFKLMIFDLDGLLVDSQSLQWESYSKVFSKYDQPISKEDWVKYWIHASGGSKEWIELRNLDLDYKKIRDEKKIIYDELIQTKLKLKPGAKELIDLLYKEFPLVVASGSRIESIELSLGKFNLTDRFKHLISDVEMERGKPHPDVFLYAAKMMSVEPKDCLVFEDSIAGLQSAKSAGMKCVVCPDSFSNLNIKQYKGADRIVNQLSEVNLKVIKSISED